MPRLTPPLALYACLALLVGLSVGRCSGRADGAADANVAINERNVEIALRAKRADVKALAVARQARERAERETLRARAHSQASLAQADTVTADSRRILSADTATVPALRASLASQVLVTDSLSAAFRAYVVTTEREAQVAAQERAALYGSLAKADTALAAQTRLIDALRDRECRVLWLPCPTRTTAFVAGALVTLGAVVAVTR
jgi:ribosomal protein L16 Arg81 hydroxylase